MRKENKGEIGGKFESPLPIFLLICRRLFVSAFLVFIHTLLGRKFSVFCHVWQAVAGCGYVSLGAARGKRMRLASLRLLKILKRMQDGKSMQVCPNQPLRFVHVDEGGTGGSHQTNVA